MVKNALFQKLPYLSVWNLECDELHVLHLGVCQYFLGSMLWLLCFRQLPDSPAENMAKVWTQLLVYYKEFGLKDQFSSLAISSFIEEKQARTAFPRLKGKGAEVKNLVKPMLAVWSKFKKRTVHDRRAESALSALDRMLDVIDEHKPDAFFTMESHHKFVSDTNLFLDDYTFLGVEAEKRRELLFSAVPKLHWLFHLAIRSKWLNPRRVACWLDEDFVKFMKRIAARCVAGTALHKVPVATMAKYRWGLYIESQAEP
jgi:hypothetical protein